MSAPKNIRKLFLSIAASNGVINREEPESLFLARLDLAVDSTAHDDIVALEEWLGTLDELELEILADGEESEIDELVEASPSLPFPYMRVGELVEEIWSEVQLIESLYGG